jgi:hypothetical protein
LLVSRDCVPLVVADLQRTVAAGSIEVKLSWLLSREMAWAMQVSETVVLAYGLSFNKFGFSRIEPLRLEQCYFRANSDAAVSVNDYEPDVSYLPGFPVSSLAEKMHVNVDDIARSGHVRSRDFRYRVNEAEIEIGLMNCRNTRQSIGNSSIAFGECRSYELDNVGGKRKWRSHGVSASRMATNVAES